MAAYVCGTGSWGGQRLRMADYVRGPEAIRAGPPPQRANVAYALIERMSLLDVAPTIARVLGLEMKGVDGTAVPGLGR
jgi:hypothetical protein